MKKITFLKMMFLAIALVIGSVNVWGQGTLSNPIFQENFGTIADGTAISTNNTSFSWVRVGTSTTSNSITNEIISKNPGSYTGSSCLIGAKGTSVSTVDKTGLTSFSSGVFTLNFKTPSSLTSAIMVCAVGTGASFGGSSGFTGAQLSSAFQVTGTNLQIRTNTTWTNVQTVAVSTQYTVTIIFNNTANSMTYGDSKTLPSNKCHVWINGVYINEFASATANLAASAFRIYTTTAEFEVDDIAVYNVLPTTSSCTPSTLAFATPIVDKTMANVSYTQTATSLNATTPITYSSSNTAVAFTVGGGALVTIAGAGSTVITATQAAGTHNGVDYCASTASYTLNVASIAPTITVTEVTVPNMTSYVGNTKTETVNVSGINLTGDLTVSIVDDVDNQYDEPSVTTIAKLGDNTASGTVTVTYRPTASGTHTATLKIESSDATTVTRALNGTATWTPLTTPVATTANPISNSGFTANWDAVAGATEYQLDVYTKTGGNVPDLIISEYCEGSSNNKYIEIFNGTGNNIDLSQYSVELYTNGATTVGNTITLSGTLMNGDVYTIYNSGSVVAITSIGDIASTVTFFNGDDAFVLKKNGVIIDSFGQLGTDPGAAWDVNGVTTLDKTLVRKSTVTSGRTSANSTFDPSAEWDQYSIDTFDYLGTHTMTGAVTFSPISGSPFTVTGETSKAISGLSAETTYYYTVVAKNTNVASAVSNEIAVTTSPTTSIDQYGEKLNLHVSDNRIEFISSANETVAVYNAVGQKLVQKLTVNGLNSIPVSAHGVVLVKVGNRFAKVIL